jgi:hydroxymethylpyrimidine/phosphomethylpyrimidine kinase
LAEGQAVIDRLARAVAVLESCPEFARLVPEVRTNIACAPPGATGPGEVAAVDGRITVVGGMPKAAGPVMLGASDHLARRVLELRRYDPGISAALDFRWNETILGFVQDYCREHDLELGVVDRREEPGELVGRDRGSMPWKVKQLVKSCGGRVPPVFYETRGWGKEPLFILVGADPVEIAERAVDIARRCPGA